MLRRWSVPFFAGLLMLMALTMPTGAITAEEGLPSKVDASCTKCHEDYEKSPAIIAGKFADVSSKAKTIGVQVNKDMEVVHFDDSTTLENAPSFKEIPKQESVKITYAKKDGKNVATKVEVKKGLAVPKEQLMTAKELETLVAKGPDKGKYILLDSRPEPQYNEGHIPTAVSMPFFAFDKMADNLLKNKDTLQIYYCAGFSWVLSPLSARKAEKLGFTKIKVFHAGLPEWKKNGGFIVSNIAAIENFDKNSMNYILIDLRPKADVEKGHIPHAIMPPKGDVAALKDQFPKFKGAPIILYTAEGKLDAAKSAFKTITGWGYKQVSILNGGFKGWKEAGKQIDKGPAATKITYTRTLAPGEIDVASFREALDKPSSDVMILDVRNTSETESGMLPNAVNIPLDQVEQKLSEIPKGKRILIHCSTGARAEMAYNILKKAGIDAKFVNCTVECEKEKCTIEE